MDDTDRVLHFFTQKENLKRFEIDKSQIFMIGHSRGGGLGIIKAYEDNRIKNLQPGRQCMIFQDAFLMKS